MSRTQSAIVTGASGFIGSVLVDRLVKSGIQVTCLVRSKKRFPPGVDTSALRVIETSSFDSSELKPKLAGTAFDTVFHLASYGVRQEDREPQQLIDGNVRLVLNVLESVRTHPIRTFINVGSCSEYGFPVSNGTLMDETHPLTPKSPYGAAKAAATLFGNAMAARWNIPFVTLRLFNVFGTHEGPQRLIPYLILRLQQNEPVDLTPGEQVRDLLFEDDVVNALIRASESDGLRPNQVYNVCSARPVRIREVGEAVADALNKPRQLLHWGERNYRQDEPLWLVGDNRRFVEATDWRPEVSLQEGLRRMISSMGVSPQRGTHQHAV